MSTIKVDTIATRTGSGNITLSNNVASLTSAGAISGTNLSASGTLAVTGNTTMGGTAAITGNTTVGGTLVNTGLVTASAGVAIGGTGSANTLDDYEEGTWTPVAYGSSTAGTWNPDTSVTKGRYVKVGLMVYVNCILHGSITGHNGYGRISGLPFATDSDNGYTCAVQWNNMPFESLGETDHHIVGIYNQSYIHFRGNDRRINEAYGGVDWGAGSPQSIQYMRLSGCYRTT